MYPLCNRRNEQNVFLLKTGISSVTIYVYNIDYNDVNVPSTTARISEPLETRFGQTNVIINTQPIRLLGLVKALSYAASMVSIDSLPISLTSYGLNYYNAIWI